MSHQFWKTITPVVGEKIPDGAEYKTDLGWARSMTSKELRKAAELSATECFQYFEEYHEEDHDDPDSKQHYERIDMMAAHILSTVREDDGEDMCWEVHKNESTLSHRYQLIANGGLWKLYRDKELISQFKTCGDYRQLCRLLGVQLKERS